MPESMDQSREKFRLATNVSHETLSRLDRYAALLIEWNRKFNLVAASTIPDLWTRHFLDSAQLAPHLANSRSIADLGSGAGLPGLVLSIMGIPKIRLVESIGKKAIFLQTVIAELGLDAELNHTRIEDLAAKFDVLTARALKPLPELLALTAGFVQKPTRLILLKGESVDAELTAAAKYWTFRHEKIPSLTNPLGSVLILKDISPRHDAPRQLKRSFRRS